MLLYSITVLSGPSLREQKTLTPTTANFHNCRLRWRVKRSAGTGLHPRHAFYQRQSASAARVRCSSLVIMFFVTVMSASDLAASAAGKVSTAAARLHNNINKVNCAFAAFEAFTNSSIFQLTCASQQGRIAQNNKREPRFPSAVRGNVSLPKRLFHGNPSEITPWGNPGDSMALRRQEGSQPQYVKYCTAAL